MLNEMSRRIYRVVHAEIPEHWKELVPRPRIVEEVSDTSYLSDNIPSGTEIWIGGVNLGLCVLDHLIALASREPVVDGRASIHLSQSATLSYHQVDDRYGHCSPMEFKEVVNEVMQRTQIQVLLAD